MATFVAAAAEELEDGLALPVAEPLCEAADPDEELPPADWLALDVLECEVLVRKTVVEEPTDTVKEEAFPYGSTVTPGERPAGTRATPGCDVTAGGCVVTMAVATLSVNVAAVG